MNAKKLLKQAQKLVPETLLARLQKLHSNLLFTLISRRHQALGWSLKSAMVFSPHQDDETFGCGGMIALKRAQGIAVQVVFLTDGQGDNLNPQIVQIRTDEALTALRILGVDQSQIHFLAKPDGTLQNLPLLEQQQLIEQLVNLLKFYQPQEVYVPHSQDCHCDHEATYELVRSALANSEVKAELWQYPIWLLWRAPIFIMLKLQDLATARLLSIDSVRATKSQAIAAYRSQIHSLPQGFVQQFLGNAEVFFPEKTD